MDINVEIIERLTRLETKQEMGFAEQSKVLAAQKDAIDAHIKAQNETIKSLKADVSKLQSILDRGKGAFVASLLLAAVIGGGAMKALDFLKALSLKGL